MLDIPFTRAMQHEKLNLFTAVKLSRNKNQDTMAIREIPLTN